MILESMFRSNQIRPSDARMPADRRLSERIGRTGLGAGLVPGEQLGLWSSRENAAVHRRMRRVPASASSAKFAADGAIRGTTARTWDRFMRIG